MYSNLVPFESILETVKDDTGITNLRNMYPKIRRLIHRVEKDIGYGATAILKKVFYSVEKGSIIYNGETYRIKLPADMIRLEAVGMCHNGICPGDYKIQGNHMFFAGKKRVEQFYLMYYTLVADGEGNPVTTENHAEAVAAGISYWLYKPRRFNDKGSRSTYKDLEQYYHDRLSEARGDDIMPSTAEEFSQAAGVMNMSSKDAQLHSGPDRSFDNINEGLDPSDMVIDNPDNGGDPDPTDEPPIYSFQFGNLQDDITSHPTITDAWLTENGTLHSEAALLDGKFINYLGLGRIGFAIKTLTADKYWFTDILMNILNSEIFDKHYDAAKEMDIYVSKEYYAECSVYYKFLKQ